MRKAATGVTGVAVGIGIVELLHPSGLLLLGLFVVGCLALIARLTASPLLLGRADHETWFDHPTGEVVVHHAERAGAVGRKITSE